MASIERECEVEDRRGEKRALEKPEEEEEEGEEEEEEENEADEEQGSQPVFLDDRNTIPKLFSRQLQQQLQNEHSERPVEEEEATPSEAGERKYVFIPPFQTPQFQTLLGTLQAIYTARFEDLNEVAFEKAFWARMATYHTLIDNEHELNACCLPPECDNKPLAEALEYLATTFPFPLLLSVGLEALAKEAAVKFKSAHEFKAEQLDFASLGQQTRGRHVVFTCSWVDFLKNIYDVKEFLCKLRMLFDAVYVWSVDTIMIVALAYGVKEIPKGCRFLSRFTIKALPEILNRIESGCQVMWGTFNITRAGIKPRKQFWQNLCTTKGLTTEATLLSYCEKNKSFGELAAEWRLLWNSEPCFLRFCKKVTKDADNLLATGPSFTVEDKMFLLVHLFSPDNWQHIRKYVDRESPPCQQCLIDQWLLFWVDFFHKNGLCPFEFCRWLMLSFVTNEEGEPVNNKANVTVIGGLCMTGKSLFTFCLSKLVKAFRPITFKAVKQQLPYISRSDLLILDEASENSLRYCSKIESRGVFDGKPHCESVMTKPLLINTTRVSAKLPEQGQTEGEETRYHEFKSRGKWVWLEKNTQVPEVPTEAHIALAQLMLFSKRVKPSQLLNNETDAFPEFAQRVQWTSKYGHAYRKNVLRRNNVLPNEDWYITQFTEDTPDEKQTVFQRRLEENDVNFEKLTLEQKLADFLSQNKFDENRMKLLVGDRLFGKVQWFLRNAGFMEILKQKPYDVESVERKNINNGLPRIFISTRALSNLKEVMDVAELRANGADPGTLNNADNPQENG